LGALLVTVLLTQPGLEFHVIGDHLFHHDIQYFLSTDSDEPGIVFEQFARVLFETDSSLQDDWLLRIPQHLVSPSSLLVPFSFLSLWRRGQNTRRCMLRRWAGATPRVTFGNEGPKNGVAPAQLRVLAPSLFFAVSFASIWLSLASPVFRVTPKQNGPLNLILCIHSA
jgi:hypothetical protein